MSLDAAIADVATVHGRFVATARRRPEAPFLFIESVTAKTYDILAGPMSWAAAADEVERLRVRYVDAGYGHGHRVGLLLENRPAFLFHWFALNGIGASVVPINPDLRAAELTYLIGHSEIDLVVTIAGRAADLEAAGRAAGRSAFRPFVTAGPQDETLPRASTSAPRANEALGLATECALLYTSGTTGRPKGCVLGNDYFLRAGAWYAGLDDLCEVHRDGERIVTPLPLHHVNAMAFSTMVVLMAGGCLVQLDRFHQKTWWQSVRESQATIVHYLGVMPAMLLAAPESKDDRDHDVRWAFGAGVDRRNHARFEERFGFPLVEAWAMTETGAAAVIMANHEPRHVGSHCFGREEAFVEVRLVDDRGVEVEPGMDGELLVRSAGPDPRRYFFAGYLKDDAATDAAWAGGWFHTGDVVRRNGDGSLHFVDRRKNVIRRSGENISALEVESVLNQHPVVRASAVAATPDSLRGDEVLACIVVDGVVADHERPAVAESIVRHALAQLAYFKAPGFVAFVDEVPLTASQKIQRGQLRELARTLPGQRHCYDLRALKKRQA
jgi:acyl-CoA synthetase (AMP-forming)/AMP-acid ligase II